MYLVFLILRPRSYGNDWLRAYGCMLEGQTQRGPVLAIIEDVHWIDPTTEELLLRAVHRLSQYPICLLATSREPFPETWSSGDNATCIARGDKHDRQQVSGPRRFQWQPCGPNR